MLQNRNRLVAFRLSEEEYEELRLASETRGARSVSDFVRSAVIWTTANCERPIGDLLFPPEVGARHGTRSGGTPSRTAAEETEQCGPTADSLATIRDLSSKLDSLLRLVHNPAGRQESGEGQRI